MKITYVDAATLTERIVYTDQAKCPQCGSHAVTVTREFYTHPSLPQVVENHRCRSCSHRWAHYFKEAPKED